MLNSLALLGAVHGLGRKPLNLPTANPAGRRKIGHGGMSWALPTDTDRLRQPQDGSAESRIKVATMRSKTSLIQEPDDASMTGGTRSLTRRLLGLNFGSKLRKPLAVAIGPVRQARVA